MTYAQPDWLSGLLFLLQPHMNTGGKKYQEAALANSFIHMSNDWYKLIFEIENKGAQCISLLHTMHTQESNCHFVINIITCWAI